MNRSSRLTSATSWASPERYSTAIRSRNSVIQLLLWLTLALTASADQQNVPLSGDGVPQGGSTRFRYSGASNLTVVQTGTNPATYVSWAGYEYEPTVVNFGGNGLPDDWRAYYCAYTAVAARPDFIKMVHISGNPPIASPPNGQVVLDRSPSAGVGVYDYAFACAPSLVSVAAAPPLPPSNVSGPAYALYYECANIDGISQVCVAFSVDGYNFLKYPQPVIPSNTQPRADGTHKYGSGHPSALVVQDKDLGSVEYLYYYAANDDSPCDATYTTNCGGTWRRRVYNGVNLWDDQHNPAIYTGVDAAMQVKYYSGPGAPSGGMFIGVTQYNGRTYFNYSTDGVHWDWNNIETLSEESASHYIGWSRAADLCVAPGTPSFGSDIYGQIHSENDGKVRLFEGEGKLGSVDYSSIAPFHSECYDVAALENTNFRGFTWNLYEIDGSFGWAVVDAVFGQNSTIELGNLVLTFGTWLYKMPGSITGDGGSQISGSANVTFQAPYILLNPNFHVIAPPGGSGITFHAIAQ